MDAVQFLNYNRLTLTTRFLKKKKLFTGFIQRVLKLRAHENKSWEFCLYFSILQDLTSKKLFKTINIERTLMKSRTLNYFDCTFRVSPSFIVWVRSVIGITMASAPEVSLAILMMSRNIHHISGFFFLNVHFQYICCRLV
jgi:hypothetical protein